jgi:hypothetical protein
MARESRKSRVLLATALVAAACAPATAGKKPAVPTIIADLTEGARVEIWINDLPVDQIDLQLPHNVPGMTDLPAYYLRAGTNTLRVRYNGDIGGYPDLKLDLLVAQLSAAERKAEAAREPWEPMARPSTVLAELVHAADFAGCADGNLSRSACEATLSFEVAARLPAWSWTDGATKGDVITDTPETRASLRAAYEALRARLAGLDKDARSAASKLKKSLAAGMDAPARADLDALFTLLRHRSSSVHEIIAEDDIIVIDPGDEMRMELFAGGRLARLWHGIPLIYLQGGAHDAPSGQMGPYSVGFDVWFRREGKRWVPAAIWRTDHMPTLP